MKRSAFILAIVMACQISSARAEVRDFKVTTDKTVDTSSLESIARDVFALSGAKTNDEKAIALYQWLHHTIFHHAYPTEPRPQSVGPLKIINVYGYGLCGSQHTVLKALYETAGWKCRYVGWPGHTTIEVFYDDRWHYLDVFLKCYFWDKKKQYIVGQEEIAADGTLVLDAVREGRAAPNHLCCGDSEKGIVDGVRRLRVIGDQKGWGSCTWRDVDYSPTLTLPSGAALRLEWRGFPDGYATKKPAVHTCGNKDYVKDSVLGPRLEHYGPRSYSSGTIRYAPRFDKAADLSDIELTNARAERGQLVATAQASAVFRLVLPYPLVSARVTVTGSKDRKQVLVSVDRGATWKPASGESITELVRQRYAVWIKVEFTGTLTRFELTGVVQHNRDALPYLVPGENRITVTTADGRLPVGCVLVVSYSFQEASVPEGVARTRFDGSQVSYGPVKTVTRVIQQVPHTFVIEVGGNTYPKMVALEREVRPE
ncbi:MAG: hypothetical protein C4346_01970 [Chloroflexota bacterium]